MLASGLAAQAPAVPLKNWPAPLYWQPQASEQRKVDRPLGLEPAGLQLGTGAITPLLVFVGMTPCRVMDTRSGYGFTGSFGPPSIAGGTSRTVPIQQSSCGIPAIAQAYSFNVTVVPPAGAPMYFLTIWPTGEAQPTASTLNDAFGQIVANAAVVAAGTSGSVNVFVLNTTDVILDINGYYASPTDLQSNTALGAGALVSNTTGANNTASGLNALQNNSTGSFNTADGGNALAHNTTGIQNTASGWNSLATNTTGGANTATGFDALENNTTGSQNTASGYLAMAVNTTGSVNTASGALALELNTTGANNTAIGSAALEFNTTGSINTASGAFSLESNTTGGNNTANGAWSLQLDTTGSNNTACGYGALQSNTTADNNTAVGTVALGGNTIGYANTAAGDGALGHNTTGHNNIAIGTNAAINAPSGNSNNIHVGSQGASTDSGTIRIGDAGFQTSFFAAGVRGMTTANNDAVAVMIDSAGQLGTVSSSRRFKEDIHDMDTASSGLMQLRPVTFRYKKPFADGSKPIQYGLVAEEVAEVYPELVARSADGQIETVKYQVLDSLLLNEVQRQQAEIGAQKNQIGELEQHNQDLQRRLARLEAALASLSGEPSVP